MSRILRSISRVIAAAIFARAKAFLTRLLRDALPNKIPPSRSMMPLLTTTATHHAYSSTSLGIARG